MWNEAAHFHIVPLIYSIKARLNRWALYILSRRRTLLSSTSILFSVRNCMNCSPYSWNNFMLIYQVWKIRSLITPSTNVGCGSSPTPHSSMFHIWLEEKVTEKCPKIFEFKLVAKAVKIHYLPFMFWNPTIYQSINRNQFITFLL